MAQLCPISGIRPAHIGTEVMLRGRVVRTNEHRLLLQEISAVLGTWPQQIECFSDNISTTPYLEKYVELRGVLSRQESRRLVSRLCLHFAEISEISQEIATMETVVRQSSWFTPCNLDNLGHFSSAIDLIKFLGERANEDGFELTRKHSLKENHITLYCHQHSCFGKNPALNKECPFRIRICLLKASDEWHVTTYNLEHSHFLDPSVYAHLVLEEKTKKMISDMYRSQVQMSQILCVIRCQTGLQLSSQQVRSLCRK